jgi:hypothetical protein
MKDIIITSRRLRQERNIYLLSFILAFIINVIAIIVYSRPWIEVISQIGYVIAISFLIYFLIWIPRGILAIAVSFFRRRK